MKKTPGFDLEAYLREGVEHFVKEAVRATLQNPKESLFLAQYARSVQQAAKTRHTFEQQGEHVPSFLIASITQDCNLSCAGCYAHANQGCGGGQMTAEEWGGVFDEAQALGWP